jgi:hypothetical protein
LYTANPELLIYCKDGVPDWVLKLLKGYPTADKLSKAKLSSVAKTPFISFSRAQELVANAQKSIASATDKNTTQLIIATTRQILHLKEVIKSQTKIMAEGCSLPGADLLKTFTRIGNFSAIGLILQIQTVERFSSVKKLASFFWPASSVQDKR